MFGEHLLAEGETIIGRYQAEIARWTNERWVSTVPPIYLTLTNQRLILQPQTRKRHDPASIPGRYIKDVSDLKANRQGIILTLKNDQRIHLFISTGRNHVQLIEQLRALAALPPSKDYHLPLTFDNLQRLIDFVKTL